MAFRWPTNNECFTKFFEIKCLSKHRPKINLITFLRESS